MKKGTNLINDTAYESGDDQTLQISEQIDKLLEQHNNVTPIENSVQDKKKSTYDVKKNVKQTFFLGDLYFCDIHENANYILIYQQDFGVKDSKQILYYFDLKDPENLQYQMFDNLQNIIQTDSYQTQITSINFHQDYNDSHMLRVRTNKSQEMSLDLKNNKIFNVKQIPMLPLSIFNKPEECYDFFDSTKQFILDNQRIGNFIAIPEQDCKIIAGYDIELEQFFVFDIQRGFVFRKFKLFQEILVDSQQFPDLDNQNDQNPQKIVRQPLRIVVKDIQHFQISPNGSYLIMIYRQQMFLINVKLDDEVNLLLQPNNFINDFEQQIQYAQVGKAKEETQNKTSVFDRLVSSYSQLTNKNQNEGQRNDGLLGLQQLIDEAMQEPKQLFKDPIAFQAVREYYTLKNNVKKNEVLGLSYMGTFDQVKYSSSHDKIEAMLISSHYSNTYAFIYLKRTLYCYNYLNHSNQTNSAYNILFELTLPRVDEMWMIEKENILVVKDGDQVILYAIQEMIKQYQLSKSTSRHGNNEQNRQFAMGQEGTNKLRVKTVQAVNEDVIIDDDEDDDEEEEEVQEQVVDKIIPIDDKQENVQEVNGPTQQLVEEEKQLSHSKNSQGSAISIINYDEKIHRIICSSPISELAYIAILSQSKFTIYYLSCEEEEEDENENANAQENDQNDMISTNKRFIIAKSLHYEINYCDFQLDNFGLITHLDFDFNCEKFVTVTNTGLLSLWDNNKKQFSKTFGEGSSQVQNIKCLSDASKILLVNLKPYFSVYNTASKQVQTVMINPDLNSGKICHQLKCDKTETFAFALFKQLLVFNIQSCEFVKSLSLDNILSTSTGPTIYKLNTNSKLQSRVYIDELCSYLTCLSEDKRSIDFHLFNYKNYAKKIEKQQAKVEYVPPPREDIQQKLIRNDKTSCCFIF
eukprot:403367197